MKKYILILGASLLTTAAVTATVLSSNKTPQTKKKIECTQKMEKKECSKMMKQGCPKMQRTNCFEQVI